MSLEILAPGLSTTVQDLGRPGHYHLGIPESGPLDRYAFRAANLLAGNAPDAAALEVTLMPPKIGFRDRRRVAVTGSDLLPKVDGEPRPAWSAFTVEEGQTLTFERLRGSARGYVAISGGIDVPVILGSRSTSRFHQLGGFDGRALKAGDVVELLGEPTAARNDVVELQAGLRAGAPDDVTPLRMMPGLYWHRITEASGREFFDAEWEVTPEADRTAVRFGGGPAVDFVERDQPFGAGSDPSNVVDCGYPYGSVQMPGGTQPIALHRDAVSGGGYFMLGTIISADMDLLGRLRPGDSVRFTEITMENALRARHEYNLRQDALYASVSD